MRLGFAMDSELHWILRDEYHQWFQKSNFTTTFRHCSSFAQWPNDDGQKGMFHKRFLGTNFNGFHEDGAVSVASTLNAVGFSLRHIYCIASFAGFYWVRSYFFFMVVRMNGWNGSSITGPMRLMPVRSITAALKDARWVTHTHTHTHTKKVKRKIYFKKWDK